jgi:DNA segregation ATPase FtsK/SpoIIIE, S-DNA-T family
MSKKRKYKKRSGFKFARLKKQTVNTVGAIWLWLIAGTITLSFFGDSPVLMKLRESLFGHFGWTYFLFPPFLVLLSLLFFRLKSTIAHANVSTGFGLLILSLLGMTHTGSVGEYMWDFVAKFINQEGAMLVYLTVLVISIIVIFNTSLDAFVNFLLVSIGSWFEKITDKMNAMDDMKRKSTLFDDKNPVKIKGLEEEKSPFSKISGISLASANSSQKTQGKTTETSVKSGLSIKSPVNMKPQQTSMWEYPPLTLLSDGPGGKADRGDVKKNANTIEETLNSFGIEGQIVDCKRAPAVTQYCLRLAKGTRLSKLTSLSSDLALALAAPTGAVRIEAPIPGQDLVGIEIPNRGLEFVTLKHMLQSPVMQNTKNKLAVALGLDVSGSPLIADINKMPHVLVAGTTGSGKSVLVNSWICSLLFRMTPDEVRLILVDPKRVELTGYNGVPHLMVPVIVEPDKILSALRWATTEMETRYKRFAEVGVRNIDGFNELSGFQAMPYIVIFIDELADIMAYSPVEVEDAICRIAQMARATGIHLVLATQRPSVDVITGLIKANVPSRIAFNVSSMVDSRVILDMPGAEKLLGRGDMLYIPPDQAKPSRIQGTYVSEKEVANMVTFLREKNIPVQYTEEVLTQTSPAGKKGGGSVSGGSGGGTDALFDDALRLICQHDKASASLLQRRLQVGYARAARILDQLEEAGIISPGEGAKPRDVLIKNPDDYYAQQQTQPQQE